MGARFNEGQWTAGVGKYKYGGSVRWLQTKRRVSLLWEHSTSPPLTDEVREELVAQTKALVLNVLNMESVDSVVGSTSIVVGPGDWRCKAA